MNKAFINKILSRFGVEMHGSSYMQSLRKAAVTPDVFEIQKSLLGKDANVIFDLGANYGGITKVYKKIFPKSKIYGFEPFPDMFKQLTENTSALQDVSIYELAIADGKSTRTFFVNEGVDTNSLLESKQTGMRSDDLVKNREKIIVQTTSIDEFCKENNIDHIDILKMDIQGGELDALKGATTLLADKKISLIYAETNFIAQYVDQPLFQDLLGFLDKCGYQLQDIYNPYYGKGSLAWCDAIFLPKK